MNDVSAGVPNLTSVLRDKSLKGKNVQLSAATKAALDAIAQSVADGIVKKADGNPRKMARLFHPMKSYLDVRLKKAPEVGQKKAVAYLKAKIESILRQKAAGG